MGIMVFPWAEMGSPKMVFTPAWPTMLSLSDCKRATLPIRELPQRNYPPNGLSSQLKREEAKFSWTICPIPVLPFDYMVKAGQPAPPEDCCLEARRGAERQRRYRESTASVFHFKHVAAVLFPLINC